MSTLWTLRASSTSQNIDNHAFTYYDFKLKSVLSPLKKFKTNLQTWKKPFSSWRVAIFYRLKRWKKKKVNLKRKQYCSQKNWDSVRRNLLYTHTNLFDQDYLDSRETDSCHKSGRGETIFYYPVIKYVRDRIIIHKCWRWQPLRVRTGIRGIWKHIVPSTHPRNRSFQTLNNRCTCLAWYSRFLA